MGEIYFLKDLEQIREDADSGWRFLLRIFQWPSLIRALCRELLYEQDRAKAAIQHNEELRAELNVIRSKLGQLEVDMALTRKGNNVLLAFIHRSQRLSVPFAEGSIRTELQKSNTRPK